MVSRKNDDEKYGEEREERQTKSETGPQTRHIWCAKMKTATKSGGKETTQKDSVNR